MGLKIMTDNYYCMQSAVHCCLCSQSTLVSVSLFVGVDYAMSVLSLNSG